MDPQNYPGENEPQVHNLPPFNQPQSSELPPPDNANFLPPVSAQDPDQSAWTATSGGPGIPGQAGESQDDEDKKEKIRQLLKRISAVSIVLFLLFLLFWLIFLRGGSKKSSEDKIKEAANQVEQIAAEVAEAPDLLNFAARGENEGTYTVYNVSVEKGGERKISRKLEVSDITNPTDIEGEMVLFATKGGVYLSDNGGKSYQQIISIAILDEITSIKISKDRKSVAYGLLGPEGKNSVRAYDITNGQTVDLFIAGDQGVFIHDWNASLNKMVYTEGCFYCDGHTTKPILRDLNTGGTKSLYSEPGSNILSIEVSEDFKTMLFVTAAVDDAIYGTGINASGPPYTLHKMDLNSLSDKVVETFGTKNEKRPDGSNYYRNVWIGFTKGASPKPYFAEGKKITIVDGDEKKTLFEFDKDIYSLGYVSDVNVLAGLGTDAKWVVSKFSVQDKKSQLLLDGDKNTIFFGVSNK